MKVRASHILVKTAPEALEIKKGIESNKNRKAIRFNIEKQLSDIQERMDSKVSIEEILQEKIGA